MRCSFLCYDKIEMLRIAYDPAYYSDEQMLKWGREAMREAKKNNRKKISSAFLKAKQVTECGFKDI